MCMGTNPENTGSSFEIEEGYDGDVYHLIEYDDVELLRSGFVQDENTVYWFKSEYDTPPDRAFYSANHHWARRKAKLFAELVHRTEGFEQKSGIPVDVAVEGKPAIAAYLYVVKNLPLDEERIPMGVPRDAEERNVADEMGLKYETVRQYLRDFEEGRR